MSELSASSLLACFCSLASSDFGWTWSRQEAIIWPGTKAGYVPKSILLPSVLGS